MKNKLKNYVNKWLDLIKVEREYEIKFHKEEIRRLGKNRELVGRAILNLNGKIIGEMYNKYLVKFGRKKEFRDLNIKVGDVVLISKGDPLKSDILGDVVEIGKNHIIVAFENLPPKDILKNVRIDLYTNDVTFKRMENALECLKEQTHKKIIKIILGLDKPSKIKKGNLVFFDKDLDFSQKEAVINSVFSEDLYLIHGPPGTGKTRVLTEVILQEKNKGNKILVCADSNTAVDNILINLDKTIFKNQVIRIGHPIRTKKELLEYSIFYKIKNDSNYKEIEKIRETIFELIKKRDNYLKPIPSLKRGLSDQQIIKYSFMNRTVRGISVDKIKSMARWLELNEIIKKKQNEIKNIESKIIEKLISEHEIILCTNSMAGSDFLKNVSFDVCIIDEGSQSIEPSCLIPITKANKLIMAGDHKQLPPTVLCNLKELKKTLFERLIHAFPEFSKILRVQYRMNKKIMEFPNRMFYNGILIAHDSVKNISIYDIVNSSLIREKDLLDDKSIIFLDIPGEEKINKNTFSYYNQEEAKVVKEYSDLLKKYGIPHVVITPYIAQTMLLRSLLDNVEINTVDGFQGREEEVVIVSFVRTKNLGFLKDLRRLNVSLTRAKRKLILVGNKEFLLSQKVYSDLLKYIEKEGKILSY